MDIMKWFKSVKSIVLSWVQKRYMKMQHEKCHDIANKIARLGYDNEEAQYSLDEAKNQLYYAASVFREKSK